MNILAKIFKTRAPVGRIPVWFMRQAGRSLPEYRALRTKYDSFIKFCSAPKSAAEATLQPLRRFDLDAAIIFSDILMIPHALGQKVEFVPGKGPQLDPIQDIDSLKKLNFKDFGAKVSPTCEALSLVKRHLNDHQSLIGFAGAPWTVACYMIEGGGSKNFDQVRYFAATKPAVFQQLMQILVESTARYLIAQAKSGADVLKIFDSWAGLCPVWLTRDALVKPVREIIAKVKAECPDTPIMYFPKGAGERTVLLAQAVNADGLALDSYTDPKWIRSQPLGNLVMQGGVDPMVMRAGGNALHANVKTYLDTFKGGPYIFNLGHGITPDMPINHIEQTIKSVRLWEKENQVTSLKTQNSGSQESGAKTAHA